MLDFFAWSIALEFLENKQVLLDKIIQLFYA